MTATATLTEPLPQWKVDFIKALHENGEFERGLGIIFIGKFAEEHGLSTNTVKSFYYNVVKKATNPDIEKLKKDLAEAPKTEKKVDKKPADPASKTLDPKLETLKNGYLDTHVAIAEEKNDPKIYKPEDTTYSESTPFKLTDNISESQLKLLEGFQAQIPVESKEPPVYKPGTLIDVEVTEVRSFGAITKTLDGHNMQGLIHISEISDKFVSDVNKHFRFGERVKARVVKYDVTKDQLSLSTRSLPIKEYGISSAPTVTTQKAEPFALISNGSADKMADLKKQLEQEQEVSAAKISADQAAAGKTMDTVTRQVSQDERSIIHELIGESFNLSAKAEAAFADVLAKFSGMRVGFALAQVLPNFQVDMGVLLAKEIEHKLSESL